MHGPHRLGLLASLACFASCSLFGLTEDEANRLAFFQENSARYYGAQRYAQALDLADQGLEIQPGDYKLLATQAWCYLRQVDERPNLLPSCERLFEQLYEMRSPDEHGAPALQGRAQTQKLLGVRQWERSRDLADAADSETAEAQKAILEANAEAHQERADYHFAKAREALGALIQNEMSLRFAHKQLMDIAAAKNDYSAAVEHGLACLEISAREQIVLQTRIRDTLHVQEEREARVHQQNLIDQEIRIRAALAEMHYGKKQFDASLTQLDELLRLDPTRSGDYYVRARVLLKLQRADDARVDFRKFLSSTKLPVSDQRVIRALEFTEEGRGSRGATAGVDTTRDG